MGKTKTKIIDDSIVEESKTQKKKTAKSSAAKATSAVESTLVEGTFQESDSQQTRSEAKEITQESKNIEPSSALRTDEPTKPMATERKPQKPGKTKKVRSKKYQATIGGLERSKTYTIPEAVDMVKKLSYSKFNGTLEAHINTVQTGIRGLVSLPFASGKKLTILVFGKGAEISGADIFGSDETIDEINKGKINFDLVITTPEWMPRLAKVARILGPRGLMPNPKNGTIIDPSADGLKKSVESFQAGKTEYKTEPKAAVIHLGLGKLDQPTEELSANIKTLLQTIGKTRIRKVSLAPTLGPSVKVNLGSI